jgi:hypothetical protein
VRQLGGDVDSLLAVIVIEQDDFVPPATLRALLLRVAMLSRFEHFGDRALARDARSFALALRLLRSLDGFAFLPRARVAKTSSILREDGHARAIIFIVVVVARQALPSIPSLLLCSKPPQLVSFIVVTVRTLPLLPLNLTIGPVVDERVVGLSLRFAVGRL